MSSDELDELDKTNYALSEINLTLYISTVASMVY